MARPSGDGARLASARGGRCLAVFSRVFAVVEQRRASASVFAEETPVFGVKSGEIVASEWNADGLTSLDARLKNIVPRRTL